MSADSRETRNFARRSPPEGYRGKSVMTVSVHGTDFTSNAILRRRGARDPVAFELPTSLFTKSADTRKRRAAARWLWVLPRQTQ